MTKKYPIGTKIKFLSDGSDKDKTGEIVAIQHDMPIIFLPKGDNNVRLNNVRLIDGLTVTWLCGWDEIKPIRQGQLMFDFMNNEE